MRLPAALGQLGRRRGTASSCWAQRGAAPLCGPPVDVGWAHCPVLPQALRGLTCDK
ncbi:unnamed protein product [Tetraodon nigroviridis]|uniref:Chromosome 4 SCAF14575, whole genome shotgun sequence n=1 Tax=Tetraodon nigroviridis TaxID=99883 RepID=Q4SJF8_TETNG|nr:unnamed protein product [Tetraodon nigroviridis]